MLSDPGLVNASIGDCRTAGNLWEIIGNFGESFRNLLEVHGTSFGTFGTSSGNFRESYRNLLEVFWKSMGNRLEILGNLFGICWKSMGNMLGILGNDRKILGNLRDIFGKSFRNIREIFSDSFRNLLVFYGHILDIFGILRKSSGMI